MTDCEGGGMTRGMRFSLCLHMIDKLSGNDLENAIKALKKLAKSRRAKK